MSAYDVGRVCVKLTGREAGLRCVVVDVIDRNYVVVAGPGLRKRRANMSHLKPLDEVVEVKRGAGDEEVAAALGRGG
ncbi:50S ribosomal protein L14e [Candidatus Bathyarchaeota archaeon RBG_16_57_9]|jgi:large subunit ribosomal protein L14e|nr:MAG: 50S ribosomal protein L14e [Candidatus Bathyarchaeota archaeon RBG_16_57_9]OGD53358.1 MAG: 50S ribosomal protein L14e [Candidatus Bathyarchaeota archaeon RBG_13_60_20]